MKRLGLFGKLGLVITMSLMVTYIGTMYIVARVTEQSFIKTYTETNGQILTEIARDFEDLNGQHIQIIENLKSNMPLKRYLVGNEGEDAKALYKIYYDIEQQNKVLDTWGGLRGYSIAAVSEHEAGRIYNVIGGPITSTYQQISVHPLTKVANANPFKVLYAYDEQGLYQNQEPSILLTKKLMSPHTTNIFGTAYIKIEESVFYDLYEGFISESQDMLVLDQKGRVLSSNQKQLIGSEVPELLGIVKTMEKVEETYQIHTDTRGKSIVSYKYLPIYDMYLISQVNMSAALKDSSHTVGTIFMICLVITLCTMLIVFSITRRLTNPLTKLVAHMEQSRNGRFTKSTIQNGSYEIRELQKVYNGMIDDLENYITCIVNVQQQKRKAELEALQMQINPHFLYNTLASIKYLAWEGNIQKLTETMNALIDLLQNTIGKTDEMIPLKQEIANLESYTTINQTRYGERIQVKVYSEPAYDTYKVPKLILQPFVENAFFHAYQKKQEGCIRVFVTRDDETLICEIVDDGDGIAQEKSASSRRQHFTGIGITNVDERIKILYGETYGVSITSEVGRGTSVKLKMPCEYI